MKFELKLLTKEDAQELFLFETYNKNFFEKHVPPRPDTYFEFESFNSILDELLAEQDEKISLFYLIKNEVGELVGRMNLVDIDWTLKSGEIGYRVGEKFTGKGAAGKALQLMIPEAKDLGVMELKARTTIRNIPSQKVLDKCGFNKVLVENENEFVHYSLVLTK